LMAKRAETLAKEKRTLDDAAEGGKVAVLNWTNFTAALQRERDDLREQLESIEKRHREQLKEVESDWEQRNTLLKQRITDLETDVTSLQRQLAQALSKGQSGGKL
jgi:t-SNARE complex subunit (syntaxin)